MPDAGADLWPRSGCGKSDSGERTKHTRGQNCGSQRRHTASWKNQSLEEQACTHASQVGEFKKFGLAAAGCQVEKSCSRSILRGPACPMPLFFCEAWERPIIQQRPKMLTVLVLWGVGLRRSAAHPQQKADQVGLASLRVRETSYLVYGLGSVDFATRQVVVGVAARDRHHLS